jgi:hypothetical protein
MNAAQATLFQVNRKPNAKVPGGMVHVVAWPNGCGWDVIDRHSRTTAEIQDQASRWSCVICKGGKPWRSLTTAKQETSNPHAIYELTLAIGT